MGLVLRKYQRDAADAPYAYWEEKPEGNPLIVLPTGGGKSLVLGTICQEFIGFEPTTRIIMATHVKELVSQNFAELLGIWPFAPAGVYSASLKRKELHHQITFGNIQSMFRVAEKFGRIDVLIIDEAHLVPPDEAAMYGKFIAALRAVNPKMLILGLTATPYRIDSGMLTEGDDALFDDIIYEITIKELIDLGYLCPLVSKATQTVFDLKGVGRSGGDFKVGALQAAVDKHPITEAAVKEVIAFASSNEQPRRSWLFFCSGVEHAMHVRDEVRRHGFTCEAIHGETDDGDRDRWIEEFKAGKITALTNANVLTTGFNAPRVDLLAMLRPTESTALYVQMVGRGTRCMGKDIHESIRNGKADCLVLDFAGNVRRHGPVDRVTVRKPGKGAGEAPVKECPECHSLIFAGLRECPDCGHIFERDVEKNIKTTADAVPILSTSKPNWVKVNRRTFYRHDKPGGTPSVRVEYMCGFTVHKEWICPEHQGYARVRFEKWWREHGGGDDAPFSIAATMAAVGNKMLRETTEIMIRANGRHYEIIGRKLAGAEEVLAQDGPKSFVSVQPSREEIVARNYELNGKPEEAARVRAQAAVANDNARPTMPGVTRPVAAQGATMAGHAKPVTQLRTSAPWHATADADVFAGTWGRHDDLDDDIPF
ncbi:DEAD/DEAH box helicase [Bradyrhizobium sp. SZCCHNR3058]|uniref:DEAD/DEAH box helicase n=1 Tax=Bradyrhizobium sp. SZCCHNR3058 TaxID=3057423 RepID=UPI002915E9DD|nr:DEAD/DEAH box helicase family protein [Bradyrhizobium sp. SZCCHNR3058]